MEYLKFSWIDYAFFSVMLFGSASVGIYFGFIRKGESTIANYFLGGKNMAVLPVTLSLVASSLSSLTLIGLPAEIYLHGVQYWMMWISWIIMGLIMRYVFLPVFFKLQFTTVYEYFEVRFNRKVRKLASAIYVMTVIVSLPVYVYGPSLAFNQVSGFNIHATAFVISCICIFYTSLGGLRAVVWADAFQFCCTFCTLTIILILGTISVGGVSTVWQKATLGNRLEIFNMDPDPTIRSTFWSIVVGHVVIWLTLVGVNPAGVQRFLAVPTFNDSKKVLIIFVVLSIVTKSIGCFSGLIVYSKYSDCDPLNAGQIKSADQIMPYFVLDVSTQSPGLSGVFVSGLLSTALSGITKRAEFFGLFKNAIKPLNI